MTRPRKPTAVLELNGAFKHDPQRRAERQHEPEPDGELGPPPPHLDEAQAARWQEIAAVATWLTDADRYMVEEVCRLVTKSRNNDITTGERSLLARNLGSLGLTPSGRASVKVPPRDRGTASNRFGGMKKSG